MKQKILTFGTPRRTPGSGRVQTRAAVGKRRKRRRTGRHTLHYILILLVAFAVMAVLSMTVFFKIEKLEVRGTTKYAAQEIIDASGVKLGDNLFRVSARSITKKLSEQFPYVETVKLKRTFPPCLTFEITQEKPLGAVHTNAGYVVIGRSGRVLEIGAQELPEQVTVVSGMYLYNPKVGQVLGTGYSKEEAAEAEKEKDALWMLNGLVTAVEETEFDKITLVDFSDRLNMMIVYDNRVMIELGGGSKLAYKLNFAKRIIEEQLAPDFEGTMDVSIDKEVWYRPANVQEELEKRRLLVSHAVEEPEGTSSGASSDPRQETIAESGSSGKDSSSEAVSSRNELETIPGTELPSASKSAESSSSASESSAVE